MGLLRSYVLELNGTLVGRIAVDSPGDAVADVIIEQGRPGDVQKKHIGKVKYSPATIKAGVAMNRLFYDWIKQSLNREAPREDATIVAFDEQNIETSEREFHNALMTETSFPALDTASKDAAQISLTIQPEYMKYKPAGKAAAVNLGVYAATQSRRWLSSSFRLNIDGLGAACSRVTKIDPLTVKPLVIQSPVGDSRNFDNVPGGKVVPKLVITLPEKDADGFTQWHQDFVIKGNNSDSNEKAGTLEYLMPDGKKAYFTLTFRNLGIFAISSAVGTGLVTAQMYCEVLLFDYSAVATLG